ncbi:MAG TPA: sulfotransferase domain-containing protein [Alphaproteobacteria bacterium]|nr:sulfotransferase domain-containing protein [Micavibrio sp.]MBK9562422.1 sulfotransferase domain-containing protein [Micavibrio sp.]HQX26775.1 sulfotransferase domain-containing protein [Alphaproteobacteria bacterium]
MEKLFDKPVVLSIGPQGCGVPWIYDYMKSRADVCLPSEAREIFYFDRHFQRGPEFYASHFNVEPQHKIVMELSTTAFDNPEAPDQVFKLLGPDVKLICPLRNPSERSKAVYADYVRYGLVKGGLEDAVEEVPQILFASRYADRLEPWLTQFGAENIHVVFYETLENDPAAFITEFCALAGLDYIPPQKAGLGERLKSLLPKKKEPVFSLSRQEQNWLKNRLQPEVQQLEKLLNLNLTIWK